MSRRITLRIRPLLPAAGLALASLLPMPAAMAQDEAPETTYPSGRAPVPTKADASPPRAAMYGFTLLIILAVVGANMIPSKRGHQD